MTPDSLAEELRARHHAAMARELESVALRLFQERGFSTVTVDAIAREAGVSARTFYRSFPTKEDVLRLLIDDRSAVLAAELAARPADEPVVIAVRRGLEAQFALDEADRVWRWIDVVANNAVLMAPMLGAIQLTYEGAIAQFIAQRTGTSPQDLVPTLLAGAFGRASIDAHARWHASGGDLAAVMIESLDVLEAGLGDAALGLGTLQEGD